MDTGSRIKRLREENKMTQEELGALVGVQKAAVQKWESGLVKNLKRDVLETLAEYFNVDPSYLMGMTNVRKRYIIPFDVEDDDVTRATKNEFAGKYPREIPVLTSYIAAGEPSFAAQDIDTTFIIDPSINADFIVKVKGDSMINAGIVEGDYAFIKEQDDIENGEIAAVIIDGDSATLKRVYKDNGIIKLVSENPAIPTMVFDHGDIRIAGKLIAVLSRF